MTPYVVAFVFGFAMSVVYQPKTSSGAIAMGAFGGLFVHWLM